MTEMDTKQTQDFAARLARELEVIPTDERNRLIVSIGRRDLAMRQDGQERPLWRGPASPPEILGREVVSHTEMGDRVGRAIFFGICRPGSDYERSVIVHVPASGTWHEVPSSDVRLAGSDDLERMRREEEMAVRLRVASEQTDGAEDGPRRPRERRVRDMALLQEMLDVVRVGGDLLLVEQRAYYQVTRVSSAAQNRRAYVARNGSHVNVAGFTVEHPGVRQLSEQEARDAGLGTVRGQILMGDRTLALAAFSAVLAAL